MRLRFSIPLGALVVAGMGLAFVAFAQPVPSCGMNMLCRVRALIVGNTMSVTGVATFGSTVNAATLDGGIVISEAANNTPGFICQVDGCKVCLTPDCHMYIRSLAGGFGMSLTTGSDATINASGSNVITENLTINTAKHLAASGLCDTRGSTGTKTCNQMAGCATLAAGTAGEQINNSLTTTATSVWVTQGTNDATCHSIVAQSDAGNVVFLPTTSCTAAVDYCWGIVPAQ